MEGLKNHHMRGAEGWSEHTKRLLPLVVGDHVRIQNQTGLHPLKWDKTGVVVEVRQFDQYIVRVDGSGRFTLRNRKFLSKYIPVHLPAPRLTIDDDIGLHRNSLHPPVPRSHSGSTARPLGHSEVPGLPPLAPSPACSIPHCLLHMRLLLPLPISIVHGTPRRRRSLPVGASPLTPDDPSPASKPVAAVPAM